MDMPIDPIPDREANWISTPSPLIIQGRKRHAAGEIEMVRPAVGTRRNPEHAFLGMTNRTDVVIEKMPGFDDRDAN
jgi:hypothetical protein